MAEPSGRYAGQGGPDRRGAGGGVGRSDAADRNPMTRTTRQRRPSASGQGGRRAPGQGRPARAGTRPAQHSSRGTRQRPPRRRSALLVVAGVVAVGLLCFLAIRSCGSGAGAVGGQDGATEAVASEQAEAQDSVGGTQDAVAGEDDEASGGGSQQAAGNDYLFLVNRDEENAIPDGWLESIDLIEVENRLGETYTVERKAAEAYEAARDELEAEGIYACLNSAYRSRAEQEAIYEDQAESFGEDYAAAHVAPGGHSEHETGIALDVILIVDGEELRSIEQMEAHPDELAELDRVMAAHGFILRYLEGKEDITGYDPELWHFRYLDDPAVAQEIMARGITLEEYLDVA